MTFKFYSSVCKQGISDKVLYHNKICLADFPVKFIVCQIDYFLD